LGLLRPHPVRLRDAGSGQEDAAALGKGALPVVVAEPSCLAAFRDELPGLLPDDSGAAALSRLARSAAEHLAETALSVLGAGPGPGAGQKAVVHPHCHQRAVIGTAADQAVLEALGYEVQVLDAGCCGLAGSFGFDAHHEPLSHQIGAELWLPKVRASLGASSQLVMDGFSCRSQLAHLDPSLASRTVGLPSLLAQNLAQRTGHPGANGAT
jgi:Fe-S oxidoreductase